MRSGSARPAPGNGLFITLEGPDGSGKTTQLRLLATRLQSHGFAVTSLRQPGGTPLGDRIRALLVDSHTDAAIDPWAELGLMFSDRAQAIAQVIRPALAAGHIVLCDRFTDSTEAYQGGGRQLGSAAVLALSDLLCGGLRPDLTLLLLPPLDQALARARGRIGSQGAHPGPDEGRFEQESNHFFARVAEAYQRIAQREPDRVMSIPDDASVDAIEARIWALVEPALQGRIISK